MRKWLEARRDAGVLPADQAAELIEVADQRQLEVEKALRLATPVPVVAAAASVPVAAIRPPVAPQPQTVQPATVAAHQPPPVQVQAARLETPGKPAFSWSQVGTYLLSERTLHAFLGLGAFLILASGVVISTLNPTGLGPVPHLASVLGTTCLFYVSGYIVRQRLRLTLTGAALLGIGGAFIPLAVWTMGQELLRWAPDAIWLAASFLCLPLYLASHALLRDRTFAMLVAVAGASELLALLNWLGVPLEWGLASLVALAISYVWLSQRIGPNWSLLSWALASSAQVVVPIVLGVLLSAKFFPSAWEVAARNPLGDWYEYAIGVAWWLGAAFFAYAAQRLHRPYLRVLAIWTVPVAYLLTLTKAPWDSGWNNVALAGLAGVYVISARSRPGDAPTTYRTVAREPIYQAAFALTLVAAFWPSTSEDSGTVALLLLAIVYGAAAVRLRQRAWAYVAVYLVPFAYARILDRIDLEGGLASLVWAALTAALLAAAELEVRRTGEARRPLSDTIFGRGGWRSLFAAPLFSVGYLVGLLALLLAWIAFWTAPAASGARQLHTPDILAFLMLVAIAVLSSISRRTTGFLYLASWLFLIPFTAVAGRMYATLGLPWSEAEFARLLAVLGIAYIAVAFTVQRHGEKWARPIYLVAYVLSLATMPLSALDRALNVQVVGLSILVYAGSAWLVHTGRHPAFAALVRRIFGHLDSGVARHASNLFMYLVCWLLPAWVLLAMSLRWPPPAVADYGLALSLQAPIYVAVGFWIRRVSAEYRWPWYLGGYALSVIGPLVATADAGHRIVALAISISLYLASAIVSRRASWLYPVALLTPVLVLLCTDRLGVPARFAGLALVILALLYGVVGVVLHHGSGNPRRLRQPIRDRLGAFAHPFFVVGYALCALGLALAFNQEGPLVITAFVLASLLFTGSAIIFRQALFGYPLALTASVAYVTGLTLTPLITGYYGLALLPGVLAALLVAEVLRQRGDAAAVNVPVVARWATPYFVVAYLGTVAMPMWSRSDQGIWAWAWWAVTLVYALSVAFFRRPVWLYPVVAAAVTAYAATCYVAVPTLSATDALAALVAPGVLLFFGAFALTRHQVSDDAPTLERLGTRPFAPRWADPLAVAGWTTVALAVFGTAQDPAAGTRTAAIAAVALALLATAWRGRSEAWGALIAAGIAFEDSLRLLAVPLLDQAPRWAMAALVLSLLAIGVRRYRYAGGALVVWPRPLFWAALVAGAGAIVWALTLQLLSGNRQTLQPLSATLTLSGLTLIAHGVDRRARLLIYLGVGLLEFGYMLQLVFFEVGQPQAFALPAGVYLLSVAYVEWRRGTDSHVKAALEFAGLTLLLGVTLIQALGFLGDGLERHAYATFLLLEGTAVLGLGAVLHWRRSFLAGMAALILDVAILLVDPMRALNTWYLAAVIGLAMIAAVIFIEQRRKQIPFWLNEWHQRLEAWE
jgi:hypothetical protein